MTELRCAVCLEPLSAGEALLVGGSLIVHRHEVRPSCLQAAGPGAIAIYDPAAARANDRLTARPSPVEREERVNAAYLAANDLARYRAEEER